MCLPIQLTSHSIVDVTELTGLVVAPLGQLGGTQLLIVEQRPPRLRVGAAVSALLCISSKKRQEERYVRSIPVDGNSQMVLQIVANGKVDVLLDAVATEKGGGTDTRQLQELRRTNRTATVSSALILPMNPVTTLAAASLSP
jgi:hypothetical protein